MMTKKLYILLFASLFTVSTMAQQRVGTSNNNDFAPKKGEWQFSLLFGNGAFFDQSSGMNYLLPTHNAEDVGLPGGDGNQSGDVGMFLNLDGVGENSLVNMVGIETKYFFSERFSINLTFNMNIGLTPKSDYVEGGAGGAQVPNLPIPNYKYTEGKMTNAWMLNVGSDYYFKTKNPRISPYLGIMGGFRMARVETMLPYTGETIFDEELGEDVPLEYYTASKRTGQIWGIQGGIVAGIDYCLAKGLILGFYVKPAVYNYSRVDIKPVGMNSFYVNNHNIQIFNTAMLKLGVRF